MIRAILRIFLISLSVLIVLILLWASIDKMLNLISMQLGITSFPTSSIEHHYKDHLWLGYIHIVPGVLFLILGAYQFIPYFRSRYRYLHRTIGKLFLSLSALIFITAILLGLFYPFGDIIESIVTLVFGIYLLYCTVKAYQTAKGRKFNSHKKWVTRIYFVALSVSTIRGVISVFMATGSEDMQSIFGLSFLIGFAIHFIMVELWIRYLIK